MGRTAMPQIISFDSMKQNSKLHIRSGSSKSRTEYVMMNRQSLEPLRLMVVWEHSLITVLGEGIRYPLAKTHPNPD